MSTVAFYNVELRYLSVRVGLLSSAGGLKGKPVLLAIFIKKLNCFIE